MRVVEKAFAYITNQGRLLVFEHVASDAGVQVPAGTIRLGEDPETAAVREANEETGLSRFFAVELLGVCEFDARPYGKDELHRRHFFHLPFVGLAPERWRHHELDPLDGDGRAIEFELYWVPLAEARACLAYGHGAFLERIR
ncbi:MAG TPA: NUDIX domain-containing protein [Polyangiaceae bacterium]|jgi:8-oxo-dGTP pyrophosphatase MutT (NUDIX family)|nr:NUDIX domain-containing protein [Polyangiaceae bacterium]